MFEWRNWRQPIEDRFAFRRERILSDLEYILVISSRATFNSAIPGFIPRYRPPHDIEGICRSITINLPPKINGEQNPTLSEKANDLMDQERRLFSKMYAASYATGPAITDNAFQAVKDNFSSLIQTTNSRVLSFVMLKDMTKEDLLSTITPGFFSEDMGRAMSRRYDTMCTILELDQQIALNFDHRMLLGPYLNLWRLILRHRWWGLLVVLQAIFLRLTRPLLVLGFSAQIAHLFLSDHLLVIPEGVDLDKAFDLSIISHPRIHQKQAAPQFPEFIDHIGVVSISAYGTGADEKCLFICGAHPGHEFYQPALLRYHDPVDFLVAFKGYVAERIVASRAVAGPVLDGRGDIQPFLEECRNEINLCCLPMEATLQASINQLKTMETVYAILAGKHVVNGHLVRPNQGRTKHFTTRDPGILAEGYPESDERRAQLDKLQQITRITARTDSHSTIKGPGNSGPASEIFEEWMMGLKEGTSLTWSANRYGRTLESMESAKVYSRQLAAWNKKEARKARQQQTHMFGSWECARINEKFPTAAAILLNGKVVSFGHALRVVKCGNCGGLDIGFDGNAEHRCAVDDDGVTKMTNTAYNGKSSPFQTYLRPLFLHDLLEFEHLASLLDPQVLEHEGIFTSRASDYLTTPQGRPLPGLPSGLDLSSLDDIAIYHKDDTPNPMRVAMALDRALHSHSHLPENTAQQAIGTLTPKDGSLIWNQKLVDKALAAIEDDVVSVCHHPKCGRMSICRSTQPKSQQMAHTCPKPLKQTDFDFVNVNRFIDLPWPLKHNYAFRVLVEQNAQHQKLLAWGST